MLVLELKNKSYRDIILQENIFSSGGFNEYLSGHLMAKEYIENNSTTITRPLLIQSSAERKQNNFILLKPNKYILYKISMKNVKYFYEMDNWGTKCSIIEISINNENVSDIPPNNYKNQMEKGEILFWRSNVSANSALITISSPDTQQEKELLSSLEWGTKDTYNFWQAWEKLDHKPNWFPGDMYAYWQKQSIGNNFKELLSFDYKNASEEIFKQYENEKNRLLSYIDDCKRSEGTEAIKDDLEWWLYSLMLVFEPDEAKKMYDEFVKREPDRCYYFEQLLSDTIVNHIQFQVSYWNKAKESQPTTSELENASLDNENSSGLQQSDRSNRIIKKKPSINSVQNNQGERPTANENGNYFWLVLLLPIAGLIYVFLKRKGH